MDQERLYVGTSGWQYRHWSKGHFYPPGLKSADWLPFFARYYHCVEVNFSFYRIPTPGMVERWRDVVPESFLFAVKMWRQITHIKRLRNCDREIRDFLEAMSTLESRRGPLLVQLPPSMKKNVEVLDTFLEKIALLSPVRWEVAVEFRNWEWLTGDAMEVLDRHEAALCLADFRYLPIRQPNGVPFVYMRRHGSYRGGGNYLPEEIEADALSIAKWLDEGRKVFVFYNNDMEGYALDNARQLQELVIAREKKPARSLPGR